MTAADRSEGGAVHPLIENADRNVFLQFQVEAVHQVLTPFRLIAVVPDQDP